MIMTNEFYKNIIRYYDYIFPLNIGQVNFVKNCFADHNSRILEVGCANGKLTNALSVYNIFGIDLEKYFIEVAYKRYANLKFKTLNMLDIADLEGEFKGIISFGNTLVHITNEQVCSFLAGAYDKLEYGGKLLLQIVNYDNILDNQISALPLIDNDVITFRRTYCQGEKFIFKGELTIKADNVQTAEEIELYPLRKNVLCEFLADSNFKNVEVFGDFKMNHWNVNSPATVLIAEK